MKLQKFLCYFGIHKYNLKRKIFNDKYECVKSIYVCKFCKKEKEYNSDKQSKQYNLGNLNKKEK